MQGSYSSHTCWTRCCGPGREVSPTPAGMVMNARSPRPGRPRRRRHRPRIAQPALPQPHPQTVPAPAHVPSPYSWAHWYDGLGDRGSGALTLLLYVHVRPAGCEIDGPCMWLQARCPTTGTYYLSTWLMSHAGWLDQCVRSERKPRRSFGRINSQRTHAGSS